MGVQTTPLPRIPAVEGWFTTTDPPALLGSRCSSCGSYAFPAAAGFCANPRCEGTEFDQVELSRTGRIWSYTDARYQPPPPYVPVTDPHQPFAIAAVELEQERLVVLGQLVPGTSVDDLRVGMPVELVLDTLFADDDAEHLVWKWRPLDEAGGSR
jgi:uncharacterized OB-fold protein